MIVAGAPCQRVCHILRQQHQCIGAAASFAVEVLQPVEQASALQLPGIEADFRMKILKMIDEFRADPLGRTGCDTGGGDGGKGSRHDQIIVTVLRM